MVVNPITPKSLMPNNQESRTSPRDEQSCCRCSRIFATAGELNVCIMCGKESHEGTCKDIARATESDLARGKIQMLFLLEGHPSSDEDVDMEVPDEEEMEPMSSEPHEKSHQPEMEEPEFHLREEWLSSTLVRLTYT